ncbi:HD domain-containing phosphohydrolase [Thiohalobacter sp. IOR34]|uniref:HD domain-containing phosphohydrolase n=1 Tax=Thiohalobacter sp. IOR34 TaxID=3057176 RepID=UPI0025AFCB8C|nr:HD domain-containing phosphohydrolase [Thiohalobacter sp. IOR34]WJW76160.1 HD domain-containing phosphohydrolase [Thiohalobacter sp. IOR34]
MQPAPNGKPSPPPLLIAAGLLTLVVALGVWLILSYVELERQRDLDGWRRQLEAVADSRAHALTSWIDRQFEQIESLAGNPSLQLATRILTSAELAAEPETVLSQRSIVQALFGSAPQYRAFRERPGQALHANVKRIASRGLALLRPDGELLLATAGTPTLRTADRNRLRRLVEKRQHMLLPIRLNAAEEPVIGFMAPVFDAPGLQPAGTPEVIGVVVGFTSVRDELYPLLGGGGAAKIGERSLLVRVEGDSLVYLSEDGDSIAATRRRMPLSTPRLAAAIAVRQPGQFAEALDYQGRRVLMTSRRLEVAPWYLVQTVDADQALKESRQHRRFLLSVFFLALFFVSAALAAAWYHGTSTRARRLASELGEKTRRLESRTRLLHAITDNLHDPVFLLDEAGLFLFANRPLAEAVGLQAAEVRGKSLRSVLGPDTSRRLEAAIAGKTDEPLLQLDIGSHSGCFHSRFIPLTEIDGHPQTLLVVLHDVTELQNAERRRERLLQQLIQALMRAVDKHDPWSADHSSRTALVATAIGREMALDEPRLRALELAANLANVGKIFVPKAILTKTGPLSAEEQARLRQHVQYALDILSSLEFEGPVLETIAQKQEHIDGSGYPQGLKEEQILLTARILAVANAFVALVSPRAYREGLDVESALDRLLAEAGSKYDRQVVAALFHVIENRGDWLQGMVEKS